MPLPNKKQQQPTSQPQRTIKGVQKNASTDIKCVCCNICLIIVIHIWHTLCQQSVCVFVSSSVWCKYKLSKCVTTHNTDLDTNSGWLDTNARTHTLKAGVVVFIEVLKISFTGNMRLRPVNNTLALPPSNTACQTGHLSAQTVKAGWADVLTAVTADGLLQLSSQFFLFGAWIWPVGRFWHTVPVSFCTSHKKALSQKNLDRRKRESSGKQEFLANRECKWNDGERNKNWVRRLLSNSARKTVNLLRFPWTGSGSF